MYKSFFKRIIDFSCAIIGLLILSPLFIIVTIGLCFDNQGKPFFFQLRPGKDGKIFKIIKFKTMNEKKDGSGNLLSDAHRLTKTGIFVRKASLDETPQLINVIKGDMSLIGPRPLLPEYLPLYSEAQKRRHEIRPGITGWAQVNGRNAISWKKKFEYDIEYIDNLDFKFDCRIIFLTIKKVLKREGVNLNEQVSAEYFNGNN
ncbi:sugar transferase [Flavobacterium sp. ZB4P13]|uniref:sugar transferase n=1 Tax=Flavobacterium sp. ZB4P13 TaxID=3401728 RepID=UPI003AAFB8AB